MPYNSARCSALLPDSLMGVLGWDTESFSHGAKCRPMYEALKQILRHSGTPLCGLLYSCRPTEHNYSPLRTSLL
jgi:hypothetical protein